jgi:hypothetical protein
VELTLNEGEGKAIREENDDATIDTRILLP